MYDNALRLVLLALVCVAGADAVTPKPKPKPTYVRHDTVTLCINSSLTVRYRPNAPNEGSDGGLVLYADDGAGSQLLLTALDDGRSFVSVRLSLAGRKYQQAAVVDSASDSDWRVVRLTLLDRLLLTNSAYAATTPESDATPRAGRGQVSLTNVYLGGVPPALALFAAGATFLDRFPGDIELSVDCSDDTGCCYATPSRPASAESIDGESDSDCGKDNALGRTVDHERQPAARHATRLNVPRRDYNHSHVPADSSGSAKEASERRVLRLDGRSCLRVRLRLRLRLGGGINTSEAEDDEEDRDRCPGESETIRGFDSLFESIRFSFRTFEPQHNSVLFYAGNSADFILLTLNHSKLRLFANLNASSFDQVLFTSSIYALNDGEWHDVKFERTMSTIRLQLDHTELFERQAASTVLTFSDVWFGGVSINRSSNFASRNEPLTAFRGTLRNVEAQLTGTRTIKLLDLLFERHPLVTVATLFGPRFTDHQNIPVASLATVGRGVRLQDGWSTASCKGRTMRMRLRPAGDGTIFFHAERSVLESGPSITRLLLLELADRAAQLTVVFRNSSIARVKLPVRTNQNGEVSLSVWANNKDVRLYSDGLSSAVLSDQNSDATKMHRSVTIFGSGPQAGTSIGAEAEALLRRPPPSYQGDVDAVWLDGALVHEDTKSRKRRASDDTSPRLVCSNGGLVVRKQGREACDCIGTDFDGETCESLTPTLTLRGDGSLLKLDFPTLQQTETNELTLRFRPTVSDGWFGGVLLLTSSPDSNDHFCVYIDRLGRLRVHIDLGSTRLNFSHSTQTVTPNEWHLIEIRRSLAVNGSHMIEVIYDRRTILLDSLIGNSTSLEFRSILLGSGGHVYSRPWTFPIATPSTLSEIRDLPSFTGQMQHLWFNQHPYFRTIYEKREAEVQLAYELRADLRPSKRALLYPLTLQAENVTVQLPVSFNSLFAASSASGTQTEFRTNLRFLFRTSLTNAILVQAECVPTSKLVAEAIRVRVVLDAGRISLRFDLDERAETSELAATSNRGLVNDDKWHDVQVQLTSDQASIMVDEQRVAYINTDQQGRLFPHAPQYECALHVGGSISDLLGYRGCVASFEMNDVLVDLSRGQQLPKDESVRLALQPSLMLPHQYCAFTPSSSSSSSSSDLCSSTSVLCNNGGWRVPSMDTCRCDCSMTSFDGPSCSKYSTGYRFERAEVIQPVPSSAFLVFEYAPEEKRDRRVDLIVFGVRTYQTDCFVLSLESFKKPREEYHDYLEVLLRSGFIVARYNLGGGDRRVMARDLVADGRYHVVRLMRNGAFASLQIDNGTVYESSGASQHSFFNAQNRVLVAKASLRQRRTRTMPDFVGLLYGLSVNGMPIFDEASGMKLTSANFTLGGALSLIESGTENETTVPIVYRETADTENGQADAPNDSNSATGLSVHPTPDPMDPLPNDNSTRSDCNDPSMRQVTDKSCDGQRNPLTEPPDYEETTERHEKSGSDNVTESVTTGFSTANASAVSRASSSRSIVNVSVPAAPAHRRTTGRSRALELTTTNRLPSRTKPMVESISSGNDLKIESSTPQQEAVMNSVIHLLPIAAVAIGCILVSVVASIVAYKCFARRRQTGSYNVENAAAERIALRPPNLPMNGQKSRVKRAPSKSGVRRNPPTGILKNGHVVLASTNHVIQTDHNGSLHAFAQPRNREWYV